MLLITMWITLVVNQFLWLTTTNEILILDHIQIGKLAKCG